MDTLSLDEVLDLFRDGEIIHSIITDDPNEHLFLRGDREAVVDQICEALDIDILPGKCRLERLTEPYLLQCLNDAEVHICVDYYRDGSLDIIGSRSNITMPSPDYDGCDASVELKEFLELGTGDLESVVERMFTLCGCLDEDDCLNQKKNVWKYSALREVICRVLGIHPSALIPYEEMNYVAVYFDNIEEIPRVYQEMTRVFEPQLMRKFAFDLAIDNWLEHYEHSWLSQMLVYQADEGHSQTYELDNGRLRIWWDNRATPWVDAHKACKAILEIADYGEPACVWDTVNTFHEKTSLHCYCRGNNQYGR